LFPAEVKNRRLSAIDRPAFPSILYCKCGAECWPLGSSAGRSPSALVGRGHLRRYIRRCGSGAQGGCCEGCLPSHLTPPPPRHGQRPHRAWASRRCGRRARPHGRPARTPPHRGPRCATLWVSAHKRWDKWASVSPSARPERCYHGQRRPSNTLRRPQTGPEPHQ